MFFEVLSNLGSTIWSRFCQICLNFETGFHKPGHTHTPFLPRRAPPDYIILNMSEHLPSTTSVTVFVVVPSMLVALQVYLPKSAIITLSMAIPMGVVTVLFTGSPPLSLSHVISVVGFPSTIHGSKTVFPKCVVTSKSFDPPWNTGTSVQVILHTYIHGHYKYATTKYCFNTNASAHSTCIIGRGMLQGDKCV